MAEPSWRKPPPELVAAFEALAARHPALELRRMFGCPAGFVDGRMAALAHGDGLVVRLPAGERGALLAAPGTSLFEPLPGRRMREYVVLSADLLADRRALDDWVSRAIAYARTLPPKG